MVGEYVRLRRMGATGRYLGLCPFHQEKTPSFNVNQTRQFYKCFGCGVGGDVLKFVMEIERPHFPGDSEAAGRAQRHPHAQAPRIFRCRIAAARRAPRDAQHRRADSSGRRCKAPQGAEARAYLAERGVTPELIDEFRTGYSDPPGRR